jgi:hypothetical protein
VSAIVAAHGGSVRAEGALGQGTTFTVHLPMTRDGGPGQLGPADAAEGGIDAPGATGPAAGSEGTEAVNGVPPPSGLPDDSPPTSQNGRHSHRTHSLFSSKAESGRSESPS